MTTIDALLVGQLAPLGPKGAPSGIAKRPVEGKIWLGREGFAGDQQGDRKHHGGVDKAVHHYALDHYAAWREELGGHPLLEAPGAFGENLSTRGLRESDVAVGDVFALGEAIIQVSQGRQPCWKLSARFGVPDLARRVQRTGRTGWYYRVLQTGHVSAGDTLRVLERPTPTWTLDRLWRALYVDMMNLDELSAMASLEHLAAPWRQHAERRLASRQVEDWTKRLEGG